MINKIFPKISKVHWLLRDGKRDTHIGIEIEFDIVAVGAEDARPELAFEQVGHERAMRSSMVVSRVVCQILLRSTNLKKPRRAIFQMGIASLRFC